MTLFSYDGLRKRDSSASRSDNDGAAARNRLGPGLAAAASNNDPTTVATLAVVGATTGYALCWLVVLLIPMLALVQALAADIGAVCKTSLQGAIRRHYGLRCALATLVAVTAVNVVTLAADVRAGSEAISLLSGIPADYFVVPFVAIVGALLYRRSFSGIQRYLTILPLAFVCYAASAIVAHFDVAAFVHSVLVPAYSLTPVHAYAAIALLGTTLTGYVYIWESIGMAERRSSDRRSIGFFRKDAALSMVAVGFIFLFILVASAATLGKQHLTVQTAGDMAAALRPIAGPWSSVLFGVGLLASAILAVPVLASTNAYVAAHTFGWNGSLNAKPQDAKAFYAVLLSSLTVAAALAFLPSPVVSLLYWASIAGGLATPITLIFLVLLAGNRSVMGASVMGKSMTVAAWCVAGIACAAGAGFIVTSFLQKS